MKKLIPLIKTWARDNPTIVGKGDISISKIGMGENNLNYLLKVGKTKYTFRMTEKKNLVLKNEFAFLQTLPKGFGPVPLHFDDSKKQFPYKFCILGYIEGKHVHKWSKKHLFLHAKKLAQLHSHTKKYFQREHDNTRYYVLDMVKELDAFLKLVGTYDSRLEPLLLAIRKFLQKNNSFFLSLKKFSLCHNDITRQNILFSNGAVHYIDWEWGRYNDPAKDLALLFRKSFSLKPWYIRLNKERLAHFLNSYLRYRKDTTLKQRVLVWEVFVSITDLLYVEWKLKNFSKQKSPLPKKFYINAAKKIRENLEKQFLQ